MTRHENPDAVDVGLSDEIDALGQKKTSNPTATTNTVDSRRTIGSPFALQLRFRFCYIAAR